MHELDVEWMKLTMGAPKNAEGTSRRIGRLCHTTSTARAHYGVTVVWRDMHAHDMWKTLWVPRDTRQMCRIQAYKTLIHAHGSGTRR